jgi:hypothetical protein
MTAGRCAGCGFENASCKIVKTHVASCNDFRDLWKANKEAALDPEAEYTRHRMQMSSTKEERRDVRIAGLRKEDKARLSTQQDRWSSSSALEIDIIEDGEEAPATPSLD